MQRIVLSFILICFIGFHLAAQEQDTLKPKGETRYTIVDQPTQFKGGTKKFYKFLGKTLKYPKDAKKAGIEGTVYVEFIVGKNGYIEKESIKIVRGLSSSCDAAVIETLSKCPQWIPAKHQGKLVRQLMTLPLNFKL